MVKMLPALSVGELEPMAAIDVNTSGAPLPKARNVTPASDSENPNLFVINSRDGERYSSAVVAKLYKSTNPRIITKGMKAQILPFSENI